MSPENFVYWLQGFFEITGSAPALTESQTKMVKEHLEYVFRSMPEKLPQHTALQSLFAKEPLIC